jgi:hypothetical protein
LILFADHCYGGASTAVLTMPLAPGATEAYCNAAARTFAGRKIMGRFDYNNYVTFTWFRKKKNEGNNMKRFPVLAAVVLTIFLAGNSICAGQEGKQVSKSAEDNSLSGKVVETMDSGAYTYMLLEKSGEKTWVAVPRMKVEKGQTVSLLPGALMENFRSSTLKRTFKEIYFSPGPSKPSSAPETTGSKGKVIGPSEKIKVEKASGPNAYTIGEIYKNISRLDRKEVVVRGKVLKVSPQIMGKNWLHLQDGTGDPQEHTADLVVTTQDRPSVGDIVTVSGTIYKDKDFGSGYKYKAIMENAHIKK